VLDGTDREPVGFDGNCPGFPVQNQVNLEQAQQSSAAPLPSACDARDLVFRHSLNRHQRRDALGRGDEPMQSLAIQLDPQARARGQRDHSIALIASIASRQFRFRPSDALTVPPSSLDGGNLSLKGQTTTMSFLKRSRLVASLSFACFWLSAAYRRGAHWALAEGAARVWSRAASTSGLDLSVPRELSDVGWLSSSAYGISIGGVNCLSFGGLIHGFRERPGTFASPGNIRDAIRPVPAFSQHD
jgi:hypothetical protein